LVLVRINTPYFFTASLLDLVVEPVSNSNVATVSLVSAHASNGIDHIALPFSFGDDIYEVDPDTDNDAA
jgi:hypothetical protein